MHGVGCLKYQVKEGDVNHCPPLHKILPTPTLDNPDIRQEVVKKVYFELMNNKKEIFKTIPKDTLSKYKHPFHYHNTHLLADCRHFKLYVHERVALGIISHSRAIL